MMSDSSPTQIIEYDMSRIVKIVEFPFTNNILHVSGKKIHKLDVVVELTPVNSRGVRYESNLRPTYDII